ncbi:MAG: DinB family protein [Bacteroidota bacterium]|nr:DinB family protein [Bacteroidota bacterium]MDP4197316.1 DinB family protein [Bacteroidota bacterium]
MRGYEYHQDLGIFLKSLKEQDKDLNLQVPWSKWFEEKAGREVSPITIGESMLQVALHSQYHRGQINSRLRELSGEPPVVDFIAWIWLGKPVAKWIEE